MYIFVTLSHRDERRSVLDLEKIILLFVIVKTGNFYNGQIISEGLHVQVAYNFVIYILAWGYCLLCPLKVLTGS